MFLTVLSGILVFVFTQFILKLILEPIVALKGTFGAISALLLREQSRLTNCVECYDLRDEIKKLSSSLLSQSYAIPCYEKMAKLMTLPSRSDLLEVSRALNHISYCVTPDAKESTTILTPESVHDNMEVIKLKLNVPVAYSG